MAVRPTGSGAKVDLDRRVEQVCSSGTASSSGKPRQLETFGEHHGQALHSTPRDTKWMKNSRKLRKKLAKGVGIIDGDQSAGCLATVAVDSTVRC